MLTLSLKEVCTAAGAAVPPALRAGRVTGVTTDSRRTRPGDLYFALRGRSMDGHNFVEKALSRRAVAAVVSREWRPGSPQRRLIRVADPEDSLIDLAAAYRRRLPARIVGVTGSNGKTTTKEMLASILGRSFRTVKAQASFNNRIGVPLTVFQMDDTTEVGVVEMGTSGPGEIDELCRVADPEVGVITTVTEAHLAGLGDLDGVIRAKSEMAHHVRDREGTLVINADDPGCRELRARIDGGSAPAAGDGVLTYGIGAGAKIRALEVKEGRRGISFFVRGVGWFRVDRGGGMPRLYAALAAIAVASRMGVEPAQMREGILRYTPPPMRMEVETCCGLTVVNDAYNANPQSAVAALDYISRLPIRGRRLMVLGDMLELGKRSRSLHMQFGREVATSGLSSFWTLGREARWAAEGARRGGMNQRRVFSFESPECLAEALRVYVEPGDAVLFKASRGVRLEEVAAKVKELLRGGAAKVRAG